MRKNPTPYPENLSPPPPPPPPPPSKLQKKITIVVNINDINTDNLEKK
jgi:hypothetical protein